MISVWLMVVVGDGYGDVLGLVSFKVFSTFVWSAF